MEDKYTWMEFYQELADKVLTFKNDRASFVHLVRKSYEDAGIEYKFFWNGHFFNDMDPFTFYGSFNKGLSERNRIALCTQYKEKFDVRAEVPSDFDGIPILDNRQSWFMDDTPGERMETYWDILETAIAYAGGDSSLRLHLEELFDKAITFKGTAWNITMALYWIRPQSFVNLDGTNRNKLKAARVFDGKFPTGSQYLQLCDKLLAMLNTEEFPYSTLPEFSHQCWRDGQEDKHDKMSSGKGNALADEDVTSIHYWIYSPGDGATSWDEFYDAGIMGIGWDEIGDLSFFNSKNEMKQAMREKIDPTKSYMNDAHATWQFANEMKPGDVVFAKKGMRLIVGRGVVESEYEFDSSRARYKNIRKVKWINKGEWAHPGQAAMKTLTDITAYTDYVNQLNALFQDEMEDDVEEVVDVDLKPYSADLFLDEVYMDRTSYDMLVSLVKKKKNVILQGAPGVGKTFAAKRLAYSIMGVKDPTRVMMVQFHQSYSYEDFIMGFRPTQEGGFELKRGSFYEFCKNAEVGSEDEPYFFIIDEINRGNLSKIFGELFMLIETDKRGIELKLLYKDEKFSVPKNVYIIGMMNTADRSLAMIDYALRRRFAFFEMKPGFETEGFRKYQDSLDSEKLNRLVTCVKELNVAISNDESLGEGFSIGHSFFCDLPDASDQTLSGIVEYELIPLLKEYWFDEQTKARTWIYNLRSAIK